MKKYLLLALCLLSVPLFAQNNKVVPDCVIQFNFTAAGSTDNNGCGTPNGAPNQPGIASWILVYSNTGFSGLTITVQSAPDNAGVPGAWGTFAGTVLTSTQFPGSSAINPNTATTSAFTGFAGYYPWMRVNLSGLTGSGTVKGSLMGFLNSTLARGGSGGGGGGTIAGTTNQIVVTGAGCSGAGTCTISFPNASVTIDPATGNFSTPGSLTSGSGSGVAGILDLAQGTAPSIPANEVGFVAPTSVTTSQYFQFPNSVAAAHQVMILGAPSGNVSPLAYKVIPDCQDSGGNHLNFTQSTDAFSCGNTSSGGGGATPTITVANAASTGTTTSTLTKLTGAPSTAVIAATTDTGQVVGICTSGCSTSGSATIQIAGLVSCLFDGATTAGHYVKISSTTGGDCSDTGAATYPTSGQVIGRVLSTNGSAGTYQIDLFPAEIQGSSGGGGGGATRGVFASRPSCSTSGSTYFSTDVSILSECNGSTWADTFQGQNVTLPSNTVFTARNTGSAVVTVNGTLLISSPSSGTDNIHGQEITYSSTPFSVTAQMQGPLWPNGSATNASQMGLYVLDNGTGKLVGFCIGQDISGAGGTLLANWNSVTSFGSTVQQNLYYGNQSAIWLKFRDDGTNFTFSISADGVNFYVWDTVSRTAFLATPNRVGFFVNNFTGAQFPALLTSWQTGT